MGKGIYKPLVLKLEAIIFWALHTTLGSVEQDEVVPGIFCTPLGSFLSFFGRRNGKVVSDVSCRGIYMLGDTGEPVRKCCHREPMHIRSSNTDRGVRKTRAA